MSGLLYLPLVWYINSIFIEWGSTCCYLSSIMLIKCSQDWKLRLEILVLKINNFSRKILPQRSLLIRTCITTQGDTG